LRACEDAHEGEYYIPAAYRARRLVARGGLRRRMVPGRPGTFNYPEDACTRLIA
jgi:hypothetical protein